MQPVERRPTGNLAGFPPYGHMVSQTPTHSTVQLAQLKRDLAQLQQTVRLMEEQRQRVIDQRRRRMAIVGGSLSILFHIALMIYLGLIYRGGGGGAQAAGSSYQLAILNEEELIALDQTPFDDVEVEAAMSEQPTIETTALTAAEPSPAQLGASAGSMPSLGGTGAGGGGGEGLGLGGGGGGGGATFFGISSKGTRIAYIVDMSASMADLNKMEICKRELIRSIQALPDYSSFYVLFFSYNFLEAPMQNGWLKARKPVVGQFATWVINNIGPAGGTQPRSSFMQVFSLETRPDVIFFLTDGGFQDITPQEISELNRRGRRCVINTIQFGDKMNEEVMRQIAKSNGGVYRFVAAEGG